MDIQRPFITARELAAMLGVSEGTLANWRTDGGGPQFVRVGRAIRYRAADVEQWIADRTSENTTEARSREGQS